MLVPQGTPATGDAPEDTLFVTCREGSGADHGYVAEVEAVLVDRLTHDPLLADATSLGQP